MFKKKKRRRNRKRDREREIDTASSSQPSAFLTRVDWERKQKEEGKTPYCRDGHSARILP